MISIPEFVQLDAFANATLIFLGSISVLVYTLIVVAVWRVSRKVNPFILLTSHVSA